MVSQKREQNSKRFRIPRMLERVLDEAKLNGWDFLIWKRDGIEGCKMTRGVERLLPLP